MNPANLSENDFAKPMSHERQELFWKMLRENYSIHEMIIAFADFRAEQKISKDQQAEMEALIFHLEQITEKEKIMWDTVQAQQLAEKIKALQELDVEGLKKEWGNLTASLTEIKDNIADLNVALMKVHEEQEANAKVWKNSLLQTYANKIITQKISFLGPQGEVIKSEEASKMLKEVIQAAPAPAHLVNIVMDAYEGYSVLHAVKQTFGSGPPLPPLLPKPDKKFMAHQGALNIEFKLLQKEVGKGVTGAELLKLIKQNRQSGGAVFDVAPNEAPFEKALELREDRVNKEIEISELESKQKTLEKQLAIVSERYQALTHQTLESPKPVSPQFKY